MLIKLNHSFFKPACVIIPSRVSNLMFLPISISWFLFWKKNGIINFVKLKDTTFNAISAWSLPHQHQNINRLALDRLSVLNKQHHWSCKKWFTFKTPIFRLLVLDHRLFSPTDFYHEVKTATRTICFIWNRVIYNMKPSWIESPTKLSTLVLRIAPK